jgi:hypothetical protein
LRLPASAELSSKPKPSTRRTFFSGSSRLTLLASDLLLSKCPLIYLQHLEKHEHSTQATDFANRIYLVLSALAFGHEYESLSDHAKKLATQSLFIAQDHVLRFQDVSLETASKTIDDEMADEFKR